MSIVLERVAIAFCDFFLPSSDMHFEDYIEGYEPSVDFTVVGNSMFLNHLNTITQ